jgi:phage virion morphogenesis protein
MTGVTLTIDIGRLNQALQGLIRAGADLSDPMAQISDQMVTDTIHRFETGTAPDGTPWVPSRRAQKTGGKTLIEHGGLMGSIVGESGPDYAAAGTNKVYGAIHQFGGTIQKQARSQVNLTAGGSSAFISAASAKRRNKARSKTVFGQAVTIGAHAVTMPARPYLGFNDREIDDFTQILTAHLVEGFTGAAAPGGPP